MKNMANHLRIAVLLAASILCTSCGFIRWNTGDNTPVTEDTAADTQLPPVTETQPADTVPEVQPDAHVGMQERLAHIKNADLSASSIIIATVDGTSVCPMTSDGDPVIASRVDAKRAVEEKFGTTIITTVTDSAAMLENARESYNSDMYYADLLAPAAKDVGTFYTEGLLANLYSLPHVDFTADYFDAGMLASAVAGDGLYAISGAANYNPEYLSCVFYNRTLAESLGFGALTELVDNGTWTMDKYRELTRVASATLGVSGHGSAHELSDYVDLLAISQDIMYVSNMEGTTPTVDYLEDSKAEKSKAIADKISSLIYSDNTFTKSVGDTCRVQFTAGTLMFSVDSLYFANWISDNNVEWGLLPLPKYDETQTEYRTLISSDAPVFCALVNTPGYETSGLILESLNSAAHEYTLDAYKDRMIDYTLRDSGSVGMLDVICDSAVYDFAHMYASGISSLDTATYGAIIKAVTTTRSLDSYYRNYKNTANRALSLSIEASN